MPLSASPTRGIRKSAERGYITQRLRYGNAARGWNVYPRNKSSIHFPNIQYNTGTDQAVSIS